MILLALKYSIVSRRVDLDVSRGEHKKFFQPLGNLAKIAVVRA